MGRVAWPCWVLFVVVLIGAQPAAAQTTDEDDARARHLYRSGEVLYSEGRYGEAVVAWKSAYDLSDRPLLLFNIANAEERMGLWEDALITLNRYRAFAPLDEREVLGKRIASLERNIAERKRSKEPEPVAEPARLVQPRPAPQVEPRRPRPAPVRAQVRPRAPSAGIGRAPLAFFAVSGVSTLTGSIFAYRAGTARLAAAEACVGSETTFCPTSAYSVLQQDRVSSIVADVGFSVGLTAAIAGTVMAVSRKKRAKHTTMSLVPAVGGASLGLSSHF